MCVCVLVCDEQLNWGFSGLSEMYSVLVEVWKPYEMNMQFSLCTEEVGIWANVEMLIYIYIYGQILWFLANDLVTVLHFCFM